MLSSLQIRFLTDEYTLPQKKHHFNFQMFYGDPGPGSVTQGWQIVISSIVEMTFGPKFTDRKVAFLLGKSVWVVPGLS